MGRSDITDVLGNTLGGSIGICCYALSLKIFGRRTIKVVNLIALAATVFAVSYFGYLFYLSYFVIRGLPPA
jgi:glycopeptide antibiotics resistance protein